jgi:hypothetical protein
MTRLVKMRFTNDCSIASVAMVTRIPYSRVLKVAKQRGFKPNGKYGMDVAQLLYDLGYEFDMRVYSRLRTRRPIPVKQPFIASVPSVNNRGGYHAIVVEAGRVLDSSNKKQVSYARFMRTRRHMYFGFRKDE